MARRITTFWTRPEPWLGLLLLWVSVSALRSRHTPWADAALTEWLRWATGLGLMLALGTWLTRTRLAARGLTVCVGLITLVGIADGVSQAHNGMVGPFRDHQLCGSAILALLPLTLAVALTAREPRWKWGAQIVGMAALICLVMTETRSAWAGAAAAGLAFAGLWWGRSRQATAERPGKQLLVPLLLLAGVGLASVIILSTSDLKTTLSGRAATLQAIGKDGDWQQRLVLWHGAVQMVESQPLFGFGLGRYPGLQWHFTHSGRVLSPMQRPSLSEQAHDLYLQTTAETGLLGLLLYVAVLGTLVGQCLAYLRRTRDQPVRSRDGFVVAAVATVAGLSVDAFASPSYQFAEVSLFVWAALGVGLAALNHREQPEADIRLPSPVLKLGRFAGAGALSLLLLSQFVPLGLLTPVEAYTAPADWTYLGATLSCTGDTTISSNTSNAPGTHLVFIVTAHYKDSSGNAHDYNASSEGTTTYSASAGAGQSTADYHTYFSGNTFTVPPQDNTNKYYAISITATFKTPGNTHPTPASVTVAP